MQTATIRLKQDKIGCEVIRRGVTPPELMFLVADNHARAGGDPVMDLKIEKVQEEAMVPELDPTGKPYVPTRMIAGKVDTDVDVEVNWSEAQEKRRLMAKYGQKRIKKFFAEQGFPKTFEEARELGIGSEPATERLLTVGDVVGKE